MTRLKTNVRKKMNKNTIKDIPFILLIWLLYFIGMFPIINLCVVIYWLLNQDDKEKSFQQHRKLTYAIYVTASLTLIAVLYTGILRALFFIPYSWGGYDEDGEWTSVRATIAALLSIGGLFFVGDLYEKYGKLTNEVKRLEEEKYEKEEECKELQELLKTYKEDDDDDDYEV